MLTAILKRIDKEVKSPLDNALRSDSFDDDDDDYENIGRKVRRRAS